MTDLNSMAPKTAMARLVRSITVLQDRELSRAGVDLTAQQAAIVAYVDVEGAKSIGEIAARIGVDQSVATRLVDRLEAKRFVARTRDPQDGRMVNVVATEQGSRATAVSLPVINALKQRLFSGVGDADTEVFWRVLTTIENKVSEVTLGQDEG
jgi:MarR family transcriptional regulator for hemolysin